MAIELRYAALPRSRALAACTDERLVQDCLLAGGDDYELAFTAAPAARTRIQALAGELGLTLTRIGAVCAGESGLVSVYGTDGAALDIGSKGFDHFGA